MRFPIQLQYKMQIGLALTILMTAIVINNISSRYNLAHAGNSVTAIYNDRLLAATYLFELTSNLHKKEMLSYQPVPEEKATLINNNMAALVHKYEGTMLTRRESALWKTFKLNLHQYDQAFASGQPKAHSFEKAANTLKALSDLQAREGNSLYRDTRSSLSATTLGSHLEIILAILTGIVALFLVGISKKTLNAFTESSSLN